ncbi:hypothetical protein E2C01_098594 [Portunus trituberculatus]|uniref:Uncharacterized protein n=1 Tax=Portunus trituberculatus TaxID=210409 RepID=A0A5B7K1L3_PORTR|nr:hypothetical protein [Portunus trituberculatus]
MERRTMATTCRRHHDHHASHTTHHHGDPRYKTARPLSKPTPLLGCPEQG